MAVDLPPGKWTLALIGPWWPAPSTALRAGAQHWSQACAEQQLFSQNLRNQWTVVAAHNQGRTADDLISRYQQGEKFHLDLAEKYQAKATAFNSGADAIDYLRSRLADIANTGNKEIDQILASKKPLPEQLAEVQAVQLRCNGDAANASRTAVDKLMTATQKILDAEGVGGDARTWARANGFNTDDVPPPCSITGEDLTSPAATPAGPRIGGSGLSDGASHSGEGVLAPSPAGPRVAAAGLPGGASHSGGGMSTTVVSWSPGSGVLGCAARQVRAASADIAWRRFADWSWGIGIARDAGDAWRGHVTRRPRTRHLAQLGAIVRIRNGNGPTGRCRCSRVVVRRDKRNGIRSGYTAAGRSAGGDAACDTDRT